MARLRADVFSDALELSTSITVILPEATTAQIGMTGRTRDGDPPVLYLLHGLSDDDTTWTRRTSIERYVAPLGLAVVMPQVHRSFYADEVHGLRYWTYLSEELPELVTRLFRVSRAREDTFVAGLSMGGYAALKWALRRPDRFAAAASLSGALDIAGRERTGEWGEIADRCWGEFDFRATPDDVPWLLEQAVDGGDGLPALYLCCGTGDRLIGENRAFVRAAEGRVPSVTSDFGPGEHDWAYWDRTIQDVLAWLPLRGAVVA